MAEQDRLAQQAEREEDRQYRWEEKEEEREAERRRRKEQEDRERQRKQQEEDTYKQLMYNIHPFPLHLPSMHSQQRPFLSSFPFPYPQHLQHPSAAMPDFQGSSLGPPPPAPLPKTRSVPVSRKSSPISRELTDDQILRRFFDHKMMGQSPKVADKWQRAWRIVDAADWSVDDLKEM